TVQTSSEAPISIPDEKKSADDSKGNKRTSVDTAVALAIDVGVYLNHADAHIQDGAKIDAAQETVVQSTLTYPFVFPFRTPVDPTTNTNNIADYFLKNPVGNITTLIGGKLGLDSFFLNAWSRAVVKTGNTVNNLDPTDPKYKDVPAPGQPYPGSKVSVAGNATVLVYDDGSHASIGNNVMINQGGFYSHTPEQTVAVSATTSRDEVNMGG